MNTHHIEGIETPNDNFEELKSRIHSYIPSFGSVSDYTIHEAAHSACEFFGKPDLPMKEGDVIGVFLNDHNVDGDEILQYNKNQFAKMGWNSFEDQTKVWTHELGHIELQNEFHGKPWSCELGADIFVGIRAEAQGIPIGAFEESIGRTKGCETHPDGKIRVDAMSYGRQLARYMMDSHIPLNKENCVNAIKASLTPISSQPSFCGSLLHGRDYATGRVEVFQQKYNEAKSMYEKTGNKDYEDVMKQSIDNIDFFTKCSKEFNDGRLNSSMLESDHHISFGISKYDDNEYNQKAAEEAANRGDKTNYDKHMGRIK